MSTKMVQIDGLSDAIKDELNKMNLEVIKNVNEASETSADEAVAQLKAKSPKRTDGFKRKYPPGSYARSWKKKEEVGAYGTRIYTVHNAKHYQLTHLLEFGHRNALNPENPVKARPHIADVNTYVAKRFVDLVENMKL